MIWLLRLLLDLSALQVGKDLPDVLDLSGERLERFRRYLPVFRRVSRETGIPVALLAAVARVESDFRPDAVNPSSGALGLMQVMPFHREAFGWVGGRSEAWRDPLENVRAGARILDDFEFGRERVSRVLEGYGGFRGDVEGPDDDPVGYWGPVLLAATRYDLLGVDQEPDGFPVA